MEQHSILAHNRLHGTVILCGASFGLGWAVATSAAPASSGNTRRLADELHGHAASTLGQTMGLNPSQERDVMNMIRLLSGKRFGRQLPPIKKHPRSITVLQDLFVALHNWMHEHNLLPLSHWGLGRGPSIGGSARMAPPSHETDVVQRLAMRRFFSELSPLFVRPGATCLEWDHVKYTQTIPSCKARWSFRYDQHRFGINERKRVIRGDLQSVSNTSMLGGSFAASKFDLVICNQVFEHIRSPTEAARGLFQLVKPGGLVYFTAPFLEPFHRVPQDFWRFTLDGASELLTAAGFKVVERRRIGNTALTTGMLLGFGVGDFTPEYLDQHLLSTFEPEVERLAAEWAFIECALVVSRPAAV